MTRQEGDRIAASVLELVRTIANEACRVVTPVPLDRNIRPEPPEATLGYLPGRVA
jgi:hypothetical protein